VTDRPRGSVSGKCAATTRLASGGDQSGHATRQQFSIAISRYVPLSFNGTRPDGYRTIMRSVGFARSRPIRCCAPIDPPYHGFTRPLLSPTRSSQDQVSDLFGMRHQREVTCIQLHGGRIHALCEKSLQVGIDRLVEFRHRIP
jgi:hypothetical protein